MNLIIKNITKESFSQYGQLITTKNVDSKNINSETTESFFDLIDIQVLGNDKKCRANIFKAKKRDFPLEINMLESHPYSSQAFVPLQNTSFIVVVAPAQGKIPDLKSIEAFKVNFEEGINFKPKVWHFPLIAIEDSNFLTIDKKDAKNNLEVFNIQNNDKIYLKYE